MHGRQYCLQLLMQRDPITNVLHDDRVKCAFRRSKRTDLEESDQEKRCQRSQAKEPLCSFVLLPSIQHFNKFNNSTGMRGLLLSTGLQQVLLQLLNVVDV